MAGSGLFGSAPSARGLVVRRETDMRGLQALLGLVVATLLVTAVSCGGGGGCEGDVFAECTGGTGGSAAAGGGTGGSAAGGGEGGGTPCVVENCPPGNDCREAACLANACGLVDRPDGEPCGLDGQLVCTAGVCAGCMAPEDCTPVECHTVACAAEACEYTLAVEDGCGPDGAGQCSAQGVCALCDDGLKNGDETGVDCGGHCGATCTTGQGCASKADCESDSQECVDGLCCDSACEGPCLSCALPGEEGLCLPFAGLDPDEAGCGVGQQCSPSGECAISPGNPCGAAAECATNLCVDGDCADCDAMTPCPEGQACVEKSCVAAQQPNGSPCAGPAACQSGFCVDGVCCDTACDGLCEACNTAYTQNDQGQCYFVISGYDPQAECDGAGLAGVCNGNGQCGQN